MGRKTKQNHITTPELIEQINPENARLVKDYLTYLRSMNRSDTTIEAYKSDLDIFFVWVLLNANNKFFIDITKRDLVSYQNWLINENENSPARVRRLKAVISSLSNYIENILDDEYPNYRSIVKKIENPVNTPVRAKTILDESDCNNLLNKLVEKKEYQKACMFALAMSSGRRKSELVRFKVTYFDESNIVYGSLYRTPEKVKSKGRGKQGKLLHFYVLVKQFKPYLDLWMQERERLGIESEWLFPDPDNATQHLSAQTLNSWAKTYSRLIGKEVYIHCLRHYWTTYLSKQGLPDNVIQEILGWSDGSLVRLYCDLDPIDEFSKYFQGGEIISQEKVSIKDL